MAAVAQSRQAIAVVPPRALPLQRKAIDLQLSTSRWAPGDASVDAYLVSSGLSEAERAWARNEKSQLLIERG